VVVTYVCRVAVVLPCLLPLVPLIRTDLLSPFTNDGMDPLVFARDMVRKDARGATMSGGDAAALAMSSDDSHTEIAMHRLAMRLRGLDVAIRALVGEHQGELLEQASQTSELKTAVDGISTRTARVLHTMQSVREDIMKPFTALKRHTRRLSRVQAAATLLRRVRRVRYLIGKLRGITNKRPIDAADSRDLAKAAQILVDIDNLTRGPSECTGSTDRSEGGQGAFLQGIPALQAELEWVGTVRGQVHSATLTLLSTSMATLAQAELASALQIFHDLECVVVVYGCRAVCCLCGGCEEGVHALCCPPLPTSHIQCVGSTCLVVPPQLPSGAYPGSCATVCAASCPCSQKHLRPGVLGLWQRGEGTGDRARCPTQPHTR